MEFHNERLSYLDRFNVECAIKAIIRAMRFHKHESGKKLAMRHALKMLNDLRKGR